MSTLIPDIRHGIRALMKNRGFALTVVLILALGIGANTAIFSVVDKLLVRTLPVKDPHQLVFINSVSVNPYFVSNAFFLGEYQKYRKQNTVFAEIAAFHQEKVELSVGDKIERVYGEYVTNTYFDMLGVNPTKGRAFTKEEGKIPGIYPVVIISDVLWKKRFNSDPNLPGKAIKIGDRSYTVIGIAPQGFAGIYIDEPTEVWLYLQRS